MRKVYVFLLVMLLSIFMLSACGENDASKNNNDTSGLVEDTNNEEQNRDDNKAENDSNESTEGSSPSGVGEIFQKTAEAMSTVEGMNISGEMETTTELMGVTDHATSKISGKISMNPYGQYMKYDEESEEYGASTMEMYITEEGMYMSDPDSGWLSMPAEQEGLMSDMPSYTTEHSLLSYGKLADLFELTEDDDHYILTFEGSGEDYKEVTYGYLKELGDEETYDLFAEDVIEGSITLELTIDKSTFYVVAIQDDSEFVLDLLTDSPTIRKTNFKYSDFGEVGEVIVPDEVVDNAKTLDMLMEE